MVIIFHYAVIEILEAETTARKQADDLVTEAAQDVEQTTQVTEMGVMNILTAGREIRPLVPEIVVNEHRALVTKICLLLLERVVSEATTRSTERRLLVTDM
jgi:hypothetical protein